MSALPVLAAGLKVVVPLAVGAALAGSIALIASEGGGGPRPSGQIAAPSPTPTSVTERTPWLADKSPPRPTFVPPVITPRSVVPGLDKGGLFGDGVKDLQRVDTSGWLTYRNDKWRYSFRYPPGWELEDFEAPNGFVPLQWVRVTNSMPERGRNVPDVNCSGITCEAAAPGTLNFGVVVERQGSECSIPGQLVADDEITMQRRPAKRCVVRQMPGTPAVVQIAVPGQDNLIVRMSLTKGRETTPVGQAILETILSTLTLWP